jgi:hypothetical protein
MQNRLQVAQAAISPPAADVFKLAADSLAVDHAVNARANQARADRVMREALRTQFMLLKGNLKFRASPPHYWYVQFGDSTVYTAEGVVLRQLRALFDKHPPASKQNYGRRRTDRVAA